MTYFPNISKSWDKIAYQTVLLQDTSSFLGTRAICLVHTLATPLKALSGLGELASIILITAMLVLQVLTLNSPPKKLLTATAGVIDVVGGAFLLPLALLANVIRGVVGATFYPAAMIRETTINERDLIAASLDKLNNLSSEQKTERDMLIYRVNHPLLYKTLVNYLI
jgi:hypothetical protein